MRKIIFPVIVFSFLFSCGGGEKKETGSINRKDTVVSSDNVNPEEKKQFFCLINGKEFTFDESYCTRKPQFEHYDFSFMGNAAFHLFLDFKTEKKAVPFTIEFNTNRDVNYEGEFSYEKPPEIYSFATTKNRITVTEWNKDEHWISLEFKGNVTNADNTEEFEVEGYFNKMPYEYFD
ncbi:MAG: hypothetical protein ACOZCO_10165 [Bacteroidota bacterium]